MQVGRNDPCPCGSGKKYKKCCLNNPVETGGGSEVHASGAKPEASGEEPIITSYPGDYGAPRLGKWLDDAIPPKDLSAYALAWNIAKRPEIAAKAEKLSRRFVSRGKEEARRIKKARSAEELVAIMLENPDSINHSLLVERVLEKTAESIPLIIRELATPRQTNFAELAVQAIYRSNYHPEEELLALITEPNATAYDLSLICMLLGMIEIEEAVKPVWDYYQFFKRQFPRKNYWKGPLIGLRDLKYALDHPIKVSDAERKLVEESLLEAGISVSTSDAEIIVKSIYTRKIFKALKIISSAGIQDVEKTGFAIKAIVEGLARLKS